MLSPTAVKHMGKDIGQHPVGTGPFTFVEWVRQSHITVQKRSDYRGGGGVFKHTGPAYLDRITFQFALDDATRAGLIESGQADITYGVPPANVASLRAGGHRVFEGISIGGPLVNFVNTSKSPGNDLTLRKAMLLAVDRPTLIKEAFFGATIPEFGILSHNTLGYDPTFATKYATNITKANQMLDAGGWVKGSDGIRSKSGVTASLDHAVPPFISPTLAQGFQAQMKAIGVEINRLRSTPTSPSRDGSVSSPRRIGRTTSLQRSSRRFSQLPRIRTRAFARLATVLSRRRCWTTQSVCPWLIRRICGM
jgi:peptide/nickel transport system substrate-binding protein